MVRMIGDDEARHVEGDLVGAEEELHRADAPAVETHVTRRVIGIRGASQGRPARLGLSPGCCPPGPGRSRPGPPEVEVVLVVPAVDRRVRGGQVHHREQPALSARSMPRASIRSRAATLQNGPPAPVQKSAVRVWSAVRIVLVVAVAAERLDLVEVGRVRGAREQGQGRRCGTATSSRSGTASLRRPAGVGSNCTDPSGAVGPVPYRDLAEVSVRAPLHCDGP